MRKIGGGARQARDMKVVFATNLRTFWHALVMAKKCDVKPATPTRVKRSAIATKRRGRKLGDAHANTTYKI